MSATGFVYMLGYIAPMAAWWVVSHNLIARGVPKSLPLMACGVGALGPITASVLKTGWPASAEFWLLLAAASALNTPISFSYLGALERSGVVLGSHVIVLAPVFIIASGWIMLGEIMSWLGIIGIALITSGVYIMRIDPTQPGRWFAPLRVLWHERRAWLWFAVTIALCKTIAAPCEKQLVQLSDALLAPSLIVLLGWALPAAVYAYGTRKSAPVIRHLRRNTAAALIVVAICLTGANICQGSAYLHGFTASVESLKGCVQPLVVLATWLTWLAGGTAQQPFRYLFAGSLTITTGVVLIGLEGAPP